MSALPKLPPSGRDLLIYQRVVVDGASTRVVAEEVGLSQTRVRQVVQRVMQWLVEMLPADNELSDAARLRLGQHIAADRLEHFYTQAARSWHETTEIKFANLCLRVILAQTKFPALPGTLEGLALDAIHGPLPDHIPFPPAATINAPLNPVSPPANQPRESQQPTEPRSGSELAPQLPPVRDCSVSIPQRDIQSEKEPIGLPLTRPAPATCDMLPSPQRAARDAFLNPAHLLRGNDEDATITEFKIAPNVPGLTTKKILSRKERRRLQRTATKQ